MFDRYLSEVHPRDLMDLAENAAGFETTCLQGKAWLQVNLRDATDEGVPAEIAKRGTSSIAESCSRDDNPGSEAGKPAFEAEFDALDAAKPVRADGGET